MTALLAPRRLAKRRPPCPSCLALDPVARAAAVCSTIAAFSCVNWSNGLTAWLICSMPSLCSPADRLISLPAMAACAALPPHCPPALRARRHAEPGIGVGNPLCGSVRQCRLAAERREQDQLATYAGSGEQAGGRPGTNLAMNLFDFIVTNSVYSCILVKSLNTINLIEIMELAAAPGSYRPLNRPLASTGAAGRYSTEFATR